MDELISKLNSIPNSYFGFVAGIVNYAKARPDRLNTVLQFIDNSENLTPSDVVEFVMDQPDFHELSVGEKELVCWCI